MLSMNENLEDALQKYILLLHKEKYFDAHEVLEEAWHFLRVNNSSLQNLVKGLINAAISFEHLKRNRTNAALKARKVMLSFERHKCLCTDNIEYVELFSRACHKIESLKNRHKEVFPLSV